MVLLLYCTEKGERESFNFRPAFPGRDTFYEKEIIIAKKRPFIFFPRDLLLRAAKGIYFSKRNDYRFKALSLAARN